MGINNIPLELRQLDQWVIWKADKKPRNPHNNQLASVSNPRTWGTFKEAVQAVKDYGAKGVGFVFAEDDPYCGIDLDKVISEDGVIDPEAQSIIDKLDSYAEVSQSGLGIHIIVRAKKPSNRCRKDWAEIYETGRYFALTGDLWGGRATIEDRQEELDWLCQETFGRQPDAEPVPVDDLVLDSNVEPPEDKLAELLEDDDAKKVWEHRARLKSISEYDWRLALAAIEAGWEDQEIADLIIAFRRQHGTADDLAKALRKDYIPNTIAKARAEMKGAGVLALLPFKVAKVLQYGEQDSEIFLVLDGGKEISMGATDRYVSPRLAQARLVENQLGLPSKALKRWNDIVLALQPLMEIVHSTTREEDAVSRLDDYISSRITLPKIESDDDIRKMFGTGLHSIAEDKEGHLYLRLSDITRYFRVHSGMPSINTKTVSRDLLRLGFEKRKFRIKGGKQIRLWISPPGYTNIGEDGEGDERDGEGDNRASFR